MISVFYLDRTYCDVWPLAIYVGKTAESRKDSVNWHTECPYTNSYALNALNDAYARDFTYEKMIQGFDPKSYFQLR